MTGFNHGINTVHVDSTNVFAAVGLPLLPEVIGIDRGDIHRIGIWGYCDKKACSCKEILLSGSLEGSLLPLSSASHTVAVLFLVSIAGLSMLLVIKAVLNYFFWDVKYRSVHVLVTMFTSVCILLTFAATVTAQVFFVIVLEIIAKSSGAEVMAGPQLKPMWTVTIGMIAIGSMHLITGRPSIMSKIAV